MTAADREGLRAGAAASAEPKAYGAMPAPATSPRNRRRLVVLTPQALRLGEIKRSLARHHRRLSSSCATSSCFLASGLMEVLTETKDFEIVNKTKRKIKRPN